MWFMSWSGNKVVHQVLLLTWWAFFFNVCLFPTWRNTGLHECGIQMHLPKFHDLENRPGLFSKLGKTKLLKSESINIDFSDLKFATCSSSENLLGWRNVPYDTQPSLRSATFFTLFVQYPVWWLSCSAFHSSGDSCLVFNCLPLLRVVGTCSFFLVPHKPVITI